MGLLLLFRYGICLMTLSACASSQVDTFSSGFSNASNANFDVRLRRGSGEGRGAIILELRNVSNGDVCIPRSAVDDPYSYEMHIKLSSEGHLVDFRDSGVIPPPLSGLVRLSQGNSFRRHYFIDHRFMPSSTELLNKTDLSAKVEFIYSSCKDQNFIKYQSNWQRI